jgi:threonine synthase
VSATLARAAGRHLDVYVPDTADPGVVERLRHLGAAVQRCARTAGQAGDPSYLAFREAVAAGATPFSCQGSDNGLTIDGGATLGWELAGQLGVAGARPAHLYVQVGGGALASAVAQGLRDARQLGAIDRLPKIMTIQTEGAFPLARAYDAFDRVDPTGDPDLSYPASHRSQFMWPWESTPHSLAHGILDDETYDWLAVLRAMLQTGGRPIVVDEPTLEQANRLARQLTGIRVDHTGSAGLAGALKNGDDGGVVLFTG